MKNKFKIIFILFMCIMMIGCNNKKNNKISEFDYVLELDSNPSTGYTWNYTIADDSIVSIEEGEYKSSSDDKNIVGAPGTQQYIVHGLKEGNTVVVFEYSQSWEPDSAMNKTTYSFSVDNEHKVTLDDTIGE